MLLLTYYIKSEVVSNRGVRTDKRKRVTVWGLVRMEYPGVKRQV